MHKGKRIANSTTNYISDFSPLYGTSGGLGLLNDVFGIGMNGISIKDLNDEKQINDYNSYNPIYE